MTERKRKRPVDEALPEITCLEDLIRLCNARKKYQNINMEALWNIKDHLINLESLVGMESVKKSIFQQVIYYLQGLHTRDTEGEYLHTQIIGPPGTGKTTVAGIIGCIYRDLGILSRGTMQTIHRDDLVAGFVGHTAIKTKRLLLKNLGGVLFFDEAYSMGSNDNEKSDSFAKEAIDTLAPFLSEYKEDFCFIIAGYEEDIQKCFLSLNKGLERRFPCKHTIEPYKSNDLTSIAFKKIKDISWECGVSFEELLELIEANKDYFKNSGGDVENYISKCKIAHSQRVFTLAQKEKFRLSKDDFIAGMEIMHANTKIVAKDTFVPSMYLWYELYLWFTSLEL